jgi:hypothetical protein
VSRRALLIDAVVAVVLAGLVLALSPGLAITGVIGLVVLLVFAISFAVGRVRQRLGKRRVARARLARRFPR